MKGSSVLKNGVYMKGNSVLKNGVYMKGSSVLKNGVYMKGSSVLKNGVSVKGSSVPVCVVAEGGFGAGEGFDEEGVTGGDGEGGAWDVEDEDLELPPDLVSFALSSPPLSLSLCPSCSVPAWLFTSLLVCLRACPSVYLFGILPLCQSSVSVCLPVLQCTCLAFYISASLLVCVSVYLFGVLLLCQSTCVSACLPVL